MNDKKIYKINLKQKIKNIFTPKKTKIKNFEKLVNNTLKHSNVFVMHFGIKSLKKMLEHFNDLPFYTRIMFNGNDKPIQVNFYKKEINK